MKLLFFLLLLSLSGNPASEIGITYRALSWSDFRSPVPENEPSVAARTTTELAMETTEIDGRFSFDVKAYFLPDSSFVRLRTDANLRHEQTHFKIAYIEARKCMLALAPLQHGDSVDNRMAFTLYQNYVDKADMRNAQFDQQTNHSLNVEAEKIWENRISRELLIFGNFSKTAHVRNSKNP